MRKAIENGDRAASSSTSPNDAEDDDEEEISPFSGFTMSSLGFGRHPASARDGAATSLLNENGQPGPYPRPIGGAKFPSGTFLFRPLCPCQNTLETICVTPPSPCY